MNGKQRAKLRGMAQTLDSIVFVGKEGITDTVAASADQALEARELIKCSVQQNCPLSAREASDILAGRLGAEGVSCTGRKFVLYRRSEENILGL